LLQICCKWIKAKEAITPLVVLKRPANGWCGCVQESKIFALTGNQSVPYSQATKWFHIAGMDDDAVFRALADASRRQLLDRLHRRNGQTLGELCRGLDMTRQAVAKHLAVLAAANLLSWRRQGREKRHFINPVPINEIAERWISKFELPRLRALSELKKDLEGESDDGSSQE
jgi:DNA-binding transcriptional ArsR family regulator